MKYCFKISFLLILLFPLLVEAQIPYMHFDRISLDQGLKQGHVYGLVEGNDGFMWFATYGGLAKYDGYQFKNYKNLINQKTARSSLSTIKAYEDKKGNMWVGTRNGLILFNLKTEQAQRVFYPLYRDSILIPVEFLAFLEDEMGNLWVGTSIGLNLFDRQTQKFIPCHAMVEDQPLTEPITIYSLLADDQKNLWAGSSKGLFKIDATNNSYQQVDFHSDISISALEKSKSGNIWMGCKTGLYEMDPESSEIRKIKWRAELENEEILSLVEDRQGVLWIGFDDRGLATWDFENQESDHFMYSSSDLNSLINNQVFGLEEDRFGNIWVGTYNGINKINPYASKFQLYQNEPGIDNAKNYVYCFYEDDEIGILVGSFEGFFHSRKLGEQGRHYFHQPDNPKSIRRNRVHAFLRDSKGKIWVGAGGLHFFYPQAGRVERIQLDPAIDEATIFDMQEKEGYIWAATTNGIFQIDRDVPRVHLHLTEDILKIPETRDVLFGSDENLWIGSIRGLKKYNPLTGEVTHYYHENKMHDIPTGRVQDIIEYPEGTLWLCTGSGITKLDMATEKFTKYIPEDDNINTGTATIQIDQQHNFWISAWEYIIKFDPVSQEFESFDMSSTPNKEANVGASYINQKGQLYFGGVNGFFAFYPEEIKDDPQPPTPLLTGFKVLNQPYGLNKSPEYIDEIRLGPDENVFTFEFAGLQFNAPANNQYAYQLEGFNEDWQYVGKKREATYTNLDPGEYFFKIKAANADGVWSDEKMAAKLIIMPALWQTNWFKSLMALTILFIGYLVYQNRQHQVLLEQQKEVAEQSAAYKSRFLANISHEIRTPMNAIVGLSKLMSDTGLGKKQHEYISAIRQSSENLLSIINDLLDHAKIESGKFSFFKKPFELDVSLQQLYHTLIFKANEKKLDFSTHIENGTPLQLIGDPIRLQQILLNLTGNAIKFTEKGQVTVAVHKIKETQKEIELLFKVTDTGIGIAEDKIEVIFESFQQAADETYSVYGGTGLGLSISKQLVEQQGGQLNIKSKLGEGTELGFNLLFEKQFAPVAKPADRPAPIILDGLKILIVEDTLFNQMLAVELLKKHIANAVIEVADNGKIALEKIGQQPFDLILMDVKMPVMDGYEATRAIRALADPAINNVPIIGLTANAIPEQLDQCRAAGMNDVVTKPINSGELFGKINQVIQKNEG